MSLKDSTNSILQSSKSFLSGTAISRFFGLIREILMAAAFGITPGVAAFWMAYRFSLLLRRLFGEGALNAAFVPHFETLRKEDPKKGYRFFYDLSMGMALLLLGLAVLVEGILGVCLIFYPIKESSCEVIRLTMLMLPALVFISLYALNTSFLNCERKYFLPSVAPSFLNFVWILAVLFFWKWPCQNVMEKLAMVIVFAFCIQWLVTVPDVYLFLKKGLGSNWLQEKKFSTTDIAAILRPFLLAILGVAATQINTALDAIFARIADPEGPAYLWYALRIQQLPLALFGIGLTGALLPPISRAYEHKDALQFQQFLFFALKQTILFMVPMTFGILVLGWSGIHLIYGHGEFSLTSVSKTTSCLFGYGIGLLPMTAVLILASAFYAEKNYRIPSYLSLASVGFNVLLNSIFVFIFQLSALSIAIATSITAGFNSLFLAYFLKKQRGPFLKGIWPFFSKVFCASLFACLMTIFLGHFVFHETLLWWIVKEESLLHEGFKVQLFHFISSATVFTVSFAGAAYLLKLREILDFLPIKRLSFKDSN